MSRDNWERLVAAVLKREQIWQLCHAHSRTPSISTISSDFSGPLLNSEAISVSPPSPVVPTELSVYQEKINGAVKEAVICKLECSKIGTRIERLCQMLQSVNDIAMSTSPDATFYFRPYHCIAVEVLWSLKKSLSLVKKCRPTGLHRIFTIIPLARFTKLLSHLDSCLADVTWVLDIYRARVDIALPPIASNNPSLSWVWLLISLLSLGQLQDKIEAASELASLAKDNDRNKQLIVEEGGISPLLKLLKDSPSSEGQTAAASALCNLANDAKRVHAIVDESGIPIIVQVLSDSPIKVQIGVVNLVARMAEHSPLAQDDLARENLIKPLVTVLTFDLLVEGPELKISKQSIHSIVQIESEIEKKDLHMPRSESSLPMLYTEGSGNEIPEVKLELKISCAKALRMLAKGNTQNSRIIAKTKWLFFLAKLVETQGGELQYNCLMTIMEITAAAESNADLPRTIFKTKSPAAKAVVHQLLVVIKDSDDHKLRIAAVRAIGSLARAFPVGETRVIGPLVEQLSCRNQDVVTEAAISLGKFAHPQNSFCIEYAKAIIESGGVPPLMRLSLGEDEGAMLHGLILICYLAIHCGKSDDLERARVVDMLRWKVGRAFVAQNRQLKKLINQARHLPLKKLINQALDHLN